MKQRKLIQYFLLQTAASNNKAYMLFVLMLLVMPVLFNACSEFKEPGVIYSESSVSTSGDPVITSVDPANYAEGGVREIKILGKNLGVVNGDTNWIFIGGAKPKIKSISNDMIVIYRPQLAESKYDSKIYINVTNPKSIDTATSIEYRLGAPGLMLGDYSFNPVNILAYDFDNNEKLFLSFGRTVYVVEPSGASQAQRLGNLPGDFRGTTDMKFGPGPDSLNLWVVLGKGDVYRTCADTVNLRAKADKIATLPNNVTKLDFSTQGNLYTGGIDGIFMVKPDDGSFVFCPGFEGMNIVEMRSFKDNSGEYIYVADSLNIYRGQIQSDGTLGGKAAVVSIAGKADLTGCRINSFTLDANGNILLSLRNHEKYSLFVVEGDRIEGYYNDEGILPRYVEKIIWGYDLSDLYLTRGSVTYPGGAAKPQTEIVNRCYKMTMNIKGAPYAGRNFIRK